MAGVLSDGHRLEAPFRGAGRGFTGSPDEYKRPRAARRLLLNGQVGD
jgi:hypothetical protein